MTLDEQKLAVASKLSHILDIRGNRILWRYSNGNNNVEVHWPTEGLQICHEAEKLLTPAQQTQYAELLADRTSVVDWGYYPGEGEIDWFGVFNIVAATYEQRLGALCRVWWPERFQ